MIRKEYIMFGEFDSTHYGLWLESREAPTPNEKEVIENIPYMNGVLDFSMLLGERIFENREIKYTFKLLNTDYRYRKSIEKKIKSQLMKEGEGPIIDSHNGKYYWLGKCKSVKVSDSGQKRNFIVEIVFDCYPFMLSFFDYFTDYFDDFDLDEEVAAWTKFPVNGTTVVEVYNVGDASVNPEVVCSATMKVINKDNQSYTFYSGSNKSSALLLNSGLNKLTVQGNGTIAFHFRKEVMA